MKKILSNLITENEQKVLLFLIVFAFIGLAAKYTFLNAQNEDTPADSLNFAQDYAIKYDLNMATKEELITIPGIGEKRALDILTYRAENGFRNKQDLLKVKGIGTFIYNKIACYFADFGDSAQVKYEASKITEANQFDLININTANADELTKLQGIGPAKAEKIIALRQELGGFSSKEELLKIKGIGPKTLDKFKDQIILGDR
ncbi:MAG: helix-hairpin-helix domain-containing protein [Candidatus Cloacimonadales bacterium]|nr:helix-hairpin-helix domain-containing protein [Candidatus Cloacimonadales bacterium]